LVGNLQQNDLQISDKLPVTNRQHFTGNYTPH